MKSEKQAKYLLPRVIPKDVYSTKLQLLSLTTGLELQNTIFSLYLYRGNLFKVNFRQLQRWLR